MTSTNGFASYKQKVFDAVNDLERLRDFSRMQNLLRTFELIGDVLQPIKENSFRVTFFGDFKAGKTTSINALLGKNILPAEIEPTTAGINRLIYDVTPSAKVIFKNGEERQIDISDLAKYITKLDDESERVAKDVKEAVVGYPATLLQDGVEVIDTPGLSDHREMTEISESAASRVDAAVIVMMAPLILSEPVRIFLEKNLLSADLGRVIFVLNVPPHISREETARLVAKLHKRIDEYILKKAEHQYGKDSETYHAYIRRVGNPQVFALNAKQALEAKERNDFDQLNQSGMPDFEQFLKKFLTEGRGLLLLQVANSRIAASASEILDTLDLKENALQMKQEDFDRAYKNGLIELANLRKKKILEMQKISYAADLVKFSVASIFPEMVEDVRNAAIVAISKLPIKSQELGNSKELLNRLNREVSPSVDAAISKLTENIQAKIEIGLTEAVDELGKFVKEFDDAFANIKLEFHVDPENPRNHNRVGEAIFATIGVLTGYTGMWAGFRADGFRGALTGLVGSIATTLAAGLATGALFPPGAVITVPIAVTIFIGLQVANFFTGGWLADKVHGEPQVEIFRKRYQDLILTEIDQRLNSPETKEKIGENITKIFDFLRSKVDGEVDALLDNLTQTLSELFNQRKNHDVVSESRRAELQQIRFGTEAILNRANSFFEDDQYSFDSASKKSLTIASISS